MPKHKLELLHEDEQLVVVNKAPGVLSIPDRFSPEKPNLLTMLNRKYEKVWTVHRIDRETSGAIVFARDEHTHRHLSQQFQERTVEKTYLALLDGQLHQEEGTIDRPLIEHPGKAGRMMVAKKGKRAVTHYRLVEVFQRFSLVAFTIETGRQHQIRVHAESMGYPLAVDERYGRRTAFYLSEIKQRHYRLGKDKEERPLMSRLCLHAWQLSLQHPATQERLSVEAPLPKDFRAVVNQLHKWGK
ncbi:MAG: RluA family pseudouridine synthase [Bacteroidetes bacterium]|jgi:RluA family pseudouridine synthase|nr:RluA family pseudouridine synthase [Bacteroidota bacterium]